MYNRSYRQRRPPTVPINYSGNAFERGAPERGSFDVMPIPAPPIIEASFEEPPCEDIKEEKRLEACEKKGEKPNFLSGLFGGKLFPRGIGSEELLLLALMILVSQSGEADDLLIYLAVLLFS